MACTLKPLCAVTLHQQQLWHWTLCAKCEQQPFPLPSRCTTDSRNVQSIRLHIALLTRHEVGFFCDAAVHTDSDFHHADISTAQMHPLENHQQHGYANSLLLVLLALLLELLHVDVAIAVHPHRDHLHAGHDG